MSLQKPFWLNDIVIIPEQCLIKFANQDEVKIQAKCIDVLSHLAENHQRVVSREELIDVVWDSNQFVGEKGLNNVIWQLRHTFKTHNPDTNIIETIRKKGYKLTIEPSFELPESRAVHLAEPSENKSILPSLVLSRYGVYASLLTILLFAFIFWYQHSSASKTYRVPEVLRITNSPGTESYPAPSPDGKSLIYRKKYKSENIDIFIKYLDSQQEERLTNDSAREGVIKWSPDGNSIYYSRKPKNLESCEIVKLNLQSRKMEAIATCRSGLSFTYMDIAPDGQTLAFHGPQYDFSSTGIYLLNLVDPDAKPVRWSCTKDCGYRDRDMAFSPDGQFLAVTRRFNSLSEDIFLVSLLTGASRQLTYGEQDIIGVDWHNDSSAIIFGSRKANISDGFILDLENNQLQRLNIEGFRFPALASNSGELFFETKNEYQGISSIVLGNEQYPFPTTVLSSEFSYASPDYSQARDRVVYISNASGAYELWSMKPDGSDRIMHTHLNKRISYPKWSKSGDKIVFLLQEQKQSGNSLHIYDFDKNQVFDVNSPFRNHGRPNWSVNDTGVLVAVDTEEHHDIYELTLADNSYRRVTFDQGRFAAVDENGVLYYTKRKPGLWKKQITELGQGTEVLQRKKFNTQYSWQLINNKVYFMKRDGATYLVYAFNLENHKLLAIAKLPYASFYQRGSISVNVAADTLFYSTDNQSQGNIYQLKHSGRN